MIESFEKGKHIWVMFGKRKEPGILLTPVFDGLGHIHYSVELLAHNALTPSQLLRQLYPKPVLAHRLSLREERLQGES